MAAIRADEPRFGGRPLRWLLVFGSMLAVAASILPARANPIPDGWFLWHAHPWDPWFCEENPIQDCYQATPYTDAVGDVEFDLFARLNATDRVGHLRFTADWTDSWEFTEFQSCIGGVVQVTPEGSQVTVDVVASPPVVVGGFGLLGRIRMQVDRRGGIWLTQGSVDDISMIYDADAGAGVTECFCYRDCGIYRRCDATMPSTLRFTLPPGGHVNDVRDLYVMGEEEEHCQVSFSEDAPWMEVGYEWVGDGVVRLTTAIDAAGLPVGEYSGRITASSECTTCTTVLLTISDELPVLEGLSWGRIKAVYR